MTLAEARALVRMYINEPKAATWSDAQLNGVIQEANREIYLRLVSICPQWFSLSSQIVWPAAVHRLNMPTKLDLTGVAIGNIVRVLGVFSLPKQGIPSTDNRPCPLIPRTRISDLYSIGTTSVQSYAGQPGYATNTALYPSYQYTMLGPDMYIWEIPSSDLVLQMHYIPVVATPTLDTHNMLVPGLIANPVQLADHHELVPLLAAVKAKTAVGDPDSNLSRIFDSRMDASKQSLAIDQQIQNPVQVRGVG